MLVTPEGKPTHRIDYYANILAHWLNLYSINKYVLKAGKMPGKKDLRLLAMKKLSEERAGYHIDRILSDKRCRLEIAKVIYSRNMSRVTNSKLSEYQDWLEKLRMEVQDLARMAKAGLVTGEMPR